MVAPLELPADDAAVANAGIVAEAFRGMPAGDGTAARQFSELLAGLDGDTGIAASAPICTALECKSGSTDPKKPKGRFPETTGSSLSSDASANS